MTIRAHLDSAFAKQFGLPKIDPPIAPGVTRSHEAQPVTNRSRTTEPSTQLT